MKVAPKIPMCPAPPSRSGLLRLISGFSLSAIAVGCTAPSLVQAPRPAAPSPSPVAGSNPPAKVGDLTTGVSHEAAIGGAAAIEGSAAEDQASEVEPREPDATPVTDFPGRDEVTYAEFIDELRKIADALASDEDVIAAHRVLLDEKKLTGEELPLESFSRARLAFESARDSGLWGIRGTVTDQMPWSDRIWQQWTAREFQPEGPLPSALGQTYPTAVGECDELGALFSILARDLGVIGFVGLHWPYWNHVVPVWQVDRKDGSFVRIVVPATQTFLDPKDTIGTTGLLTNRVVFPYVRKDRKPEAPLDANLARFLLHQSRTHGGLSTDALTNKRLWHRWNHRPGAPEKQVVKSPAPPS